MTIDQETSNLLRARMEALRARQEEIRKGRAPKIEERAALLEKHAEIGQRIEALTAEIRANDPELIEVKKGIAACARALGAKTLSGT